MGLVVDRLMQDSPARKDAMSKLIRPMPRTLATLVDPRSTGAPPGPRLPDILGLRGTKTS